MNKEKKRRMKNWIVTCTTHQAYVDGYDDAWETIFEVLPKYILDENLLHNIKLELERRR